MFSKSTVEVCEEEWSATESHDESDEKNHDDGPRYLLGWRLHLTTLGLLLFLFLVNMEVSIVSTALVGITADLNGFSKTSWIVTGFLSSYTGFIIIWTKLSDILGRKTTIIATAVIFIAFSGGCAGSSTMTQLIICRVFQGVGAAGLYSISVLAVYELVPKAKLPIYGALVSIAVAGATAAGPLIGGAITNNATWKWVFYLNIPAGCVAILLLLLAMPAGFPNHGKTSSRPSQKPSITLASFAKIDIIGFILLLAGTFLLVIALFEASTRYSWSSGLTIGLLVTSGVSWVSFVLWERFVTLRGGKQEPIFPWRFFFNRPWVGMLLVTFLVGFPFNVVVVNLPQRYQTSVGDSPFDAGVKLIPYVLGASVGAFIANVACSKRKIAFVYLLLVGAILQVIGLALLATMTTKADFPCMGYFEEILGGLGVGVTFGILMLATPFVADKRDLAVATGAVIQLRFLGGAIGLAVASAITNSLLKSHLDSVLSPEQLRALLQNVEAMASFSPEAQMGVQLVFVEIYNLQLKVVACIASAQLLAALLMWNTGRQFKPA